MIRELDTVALTVDRPERGLEEGDLGRVVHRYGPGHAFEVEFFVGDRTPLAGLTLDCDEICLLEPTNTIYFQTAESS